jgi:predicted NAD-dependent protein-ADP-ribosyltransferase YbiA (DUF1768 family)
LFLPKNDGFDHINIYSKSVTELGFLLSNFAHTPFICEDGRFASVEGYWYWLSVDPDNHRRDELRTSKGFQAKFLGRELRGDDWNENMDFKRKICDAIRAKIEQTEGLKELLRQSTLPFTHYYVYNNKKKKVDGADWIVNFITSYREKIQNDSN